MWWNQKDADYEVEMLNDGANEGDDVYEVIAIYTAQPNWREPLEALVEKWEKLGIEFGHDDYENAAKELRELIDKLAAQQKGEE